MKLESNTWQSDDDLAQFMSDQDSLDFLEATEMVCSETANPKDFVKAANKFFKERGYDFRVKDISDELIWLIK